GDRHVSQAPGDQRFERLVERYQQDVLRTCFLYLRDKTLAEDATQETFLRLFRYDGKFNDAEHEKAWLIRVASNICKDVLKSAEVSRRTDVALEEVVESVSAGSAAGGADGSSNSKSAKAAGSTGEGGSRVLATGSAQLARSPEDQHDATLEAVLSLPSRLKDVVYLYYYEGYSASEVAEALDRRASTVRNMLVEARELLREKLGGDWA
ncbi:MAG: sigma-70 family RNA polymerase sigma factor, partial [Eggerthellaceae bacterium]|nr:sigma-70 family RNA polymerase sigma factor [Eggerthellaceae bacterium]